MSRLATRSFPLEASPLLAASDPQELRVAVRALSRMQKEAVVAGSPGGAWRLFCDEGHYLEGTDLAPPPLSFFSAGMQFSVLASILRAVREADLALRALRLEQDTVYHIEGSFLRGDARGSAEPPELQLDLDAGGEENAVRELVRLGLERSPALALARDVLANRFGVTLRGERLALEGLNRTERSGGRPDVFDRLAPSRVPDPPVISKLSEAERVEGDPHGAGVGLRAEQRRTIHLRGRGEWIGDESFRSDVELVHPIGSSFRFHADGTGGEAPLPEAFLVAGIAFCTMTQLGRYAAIRKKALADYRLLQVNRFESSRDEAVARPFDTDFFLEGDWTAEEAADLVRVSERTCFLHATMRERLEPRVAVTWNGAPLAL